ncbi:DUF1365 domain-containing protein [Ramlibacter sp. MAHUQ-53]|uniref:DUF1365 domain-containing protein n=1 Tax=unclassified Ramlibacter TaxID=2617605 RepID=UPI0036430DE2
MSQAPVAQLGFGQVRHTRLRPRRHAFVYDTFFLMLPMRRLQDPAALGGLAVNRPAPISFHDSDHGDGRGPAEGGALAWMEALLRQEGITDADGEVWLHTYPRMLGYTFKPVSFWYCHRADGSLRAIVAEVNNTFGERHCYLLDRPRYGAELEAGKCFHVSPFCRVEGRYRFRFLRTQGEAGPRTVVRVDHDDGDGPLLNTSVSGTLEPVTPAALRRALWRYPAMTLMVMARIHWQALQIWLKRTGFHRKPPAPEAAVTRQPPVPCPRTPSA